MSRDESESETTGLAETRPAEEGRRPDESGDMPTMVDRFLIEDELGAGGMGRVYVAYDPTLDRKVAVKVLLARIGVDKEKASARMAREARAMARLRHPNVVTVHEVGTPKEGGLFIVMEYVPGGTLRDWQERDPEPTWDQLVQMYTYAGRGLAAAHEAGLVHRDFKPDNVLVGEDGRVQVTDFGIASVRGEQEPRSSTGTPPYMAPEQHENKPTDARTDQFAFCAALYEVLYGVRPFDGASYDEIAERAVQGTIRPPARDRGTPARIGDAILRGLSADPAKRFPSMRELLAELAPPAKRTIPARWAALIAAILLAGAVAIYAATRGSSEVTEPAAQPIGLVAVESFEVDMTTFLGRYEWREAIGDVISIVLADIDGFKTTGPTTMLGPAGVRDARESPTRPDFRAAEAKAGAAYVVRGAIEERGDLLSAQVTISRADGSQLATFDRERPMTELARLLDDVAVAIATTLSPGAKLPAPGGPRARALRAIGDEYLRINDFQMARPFLEQTVIADPSFFEGWYSLLLTRSSILAPESAVLEALDGATRTAPTPTKKRLVDGIGKYLRHDLAGARAALDELVADPALAKADLRDALYFLGEAHWHDGFHRAGTTLFKKALDVDFQFKLPLAHLVDYAVSNRDGAMYGQYAPMVATSTREVSERTALIEGRYEELATTSSGVRLHALLILGRPITAADEGVHATGITSDSLIYRAARALEAGDTAAAKGHIEKVWKQIENRKAAGELADNYYYVLRILGDTVLAAGLADEAKRIVGFLAAQSKDHPVRSYQRLSILTAGLVGDRSIIDRRELSARDATLADAIEAELAGDRAKAALLLKQLIDDPSPFWEFPERVALLRNLKALGRTGEARELCDDTLRPPLFQWSFLPARRACKRL